MNSNKMSIIYEKRRNSYTDRVCDDLCEEILQWLPIEEKIQLICVSKQFKRCLQTVWLRERTLSISQPNVDSKNNLLKMMMDEQQRPTNTRKLSAILKILPNINEFVLLTPLAEPDYRLILTLITQLCNNLQTFRFNFSDINSQLITEFSQKFGPKLKSLEIIGHSLSSEISFLLKSATSLQSLKMCSSPHLMFETKYNVRKVLVRNLKELKVGYSLFNGIGCKYLSELIDINPNLIHLDIRLETESSSEASDAIRKISALKELKRLEILYKDNDSYDNRMADSIAVIAKNCKNLKHFSFKLLFYRSFELKHFIKGFKHFSTLSKIELYIDKSDKIQFNFCFNWFENCKQLSQLTFYSKDIIITKEFFTQIVWSFPHLKLLCINTEFQSQLTDDYLKLLSQLKCLKSLSIGSKCSKNSLVTDSGIVSLISNCKHLKHLCIYFEVLITEVSVNAMVLKAIENSQLLFHYRFQRKPDSYAMPEQKNLNISFIF